MNTLIAVPTFENIAPECFKAIYDLQGEGLTFDFVKGYDCAKARNEIVKRALEGNYDSILMVDSDIIIPSDAILLMVGSPVCFGVYPRKNRTGETELFKEGTFDFENRYTYEELETMSDRFTVKGSGFGCAYIETEVFRKIPYPWFEFITYSNGSFLSEDLSFCLKACANYPLYADKRVKCGHIAKEIRWT